MKWLTRRWWLYLILVLIFMFFPIFTSIPYSPWETSLVIYESLSQGLNPYLMLQPIFHIIPLVLIVLLFIFKNKIGRLFNIYIAINFLLIAFLQNIVITPSFGLVFLTPNFTLFLIVAGFWLWECFLMENDFTWQKQEAWKFWVVPLAILAFWFPVGISGWPDFNPLYFLYSTSALAFCNMTPVYLAVMSFFHPNYNRATLRMHGFIGILYGVINIVNIVFNPIGLWWIAVLHIPLLSISFYSFIFSIKKSGQEKSENL